MSKHLPGKHVPTAADTYATIEEVLEAMFSIWSMLRLYNEHQQELLRNVSSFMVARLMRQKQMVMGPMGPGSKNDCAGKG
jgi:hypothetical protein